MNIRTEWGSCSKLKTLKADEQAAKWEMKSIRLKSNVKRVDAHQF